MLNETLSHYQITEKLGEGGMGVVYKARDTQLGRWVALKLLPPELVQHDRERRFYDEARAASALNHPNIATIYEIAESEGTHFIAMELVEGETLRELFQRGRLPLDRALDIAIQLAEGLSHAHTRGIIHRDIKPENVIVTPEGRAKILDFGLAKRTETDLLGEEGVSALPTGTAPGTIMGTVAYMSPEQAQGQPVDARSDTFSFGTVVYEMLTGERPFRGESNLDVLHAIARTEPRPLAELDPTLPQELNRIVEKALAKDPEERYQGIKDLDVDLKRLKKTSEHPGVRPVPRWWFGAGAGIAVLLALYLFVRDRPAESPAWTVRPLTSFVGWVFNPTWSPDGSFVAYGHTAEGPMDIYVMAAAGGDPIRLTEGPADDISPRWSPGSRHLAFLSDRGAGTNLYLIPPLGGTERKLAETHIPWLDLAGPAFSALGAVPWSPDASEILFSRLHPTGEMPVWRINVGTGEEAQLTRPPPGAFDLGATWSFDGERIAFGRSQGGKTSLWLMDAETGEAEPLLDDDNFNASPAWTADNERLVFLSNRAGPRNLWEIDVRSRRLRQVTTGPGPDSSPVVSPTGRLAYSPYRHQVDLHWGRVDRPQEEHPRLTSTTSDNFGGRFSPDGRQILYYSNRTGNYELWLVERETGDERQLTDHPAMDVEADWSPDGRQIVFLSGREGIVQVWVLSVEDGRVRRLSDKSIRIRFEPHFGIPRWSPDGNAIGFLASAENEQALWVVDPQGENERALLSGVIGFDWYRDSRHVVYTRNAGDGSGVLEMWVADLTTGEEVLLLSGQNGEMVVAPDGSAVSYVHSASHFNMQLHVLRLAIPASGGLPRAVGEPQQLTQGGGVWHVHNGGWSPDGEAVVYSRDFDSGDVYVIENYR